MLVKQLPQEFFAGMRREQIHNKAILRKREQLKLREDNMLPLILLLVTFQANHQKLRRVREVMIDKTNDNNDDQKMVLGVSLYTRPNLLK